MYIVDVFNYTTSDGVCDTPILPDTESLLGTVENTILFFGASVLFLYNKDLEKLFNTITDNNCPKVQVYMCADEHNQQFLMNNNKKMGLVIAGSGGTVLDKGLVINEKGLLKVETTSIYNSTEFGFVSFSFTNEIVSIIYYNCFKEETRPGFLVKINLEGELSETLFSLDKL